MSLPDSLRASQRARDKEMMYERMVEFINHLHGIVPSLKFMGKNLKPSIATLHALAEDMTKYDEMFRADHMIPEEPSVISMTQWKQGQLQGAG